MNIFEGLCVNIHHVCWHKDILYSVYNLHVLADSVCPQSNPRHLRPRMEKSCLGSAGPPRLVQGKNREKT